MIFTVIKEQVFLKKLYDIHDKEVLDELERVLSGLSVEYAKHNEIEQRLEAF